MQIMIINQALMWKKSDGKRIKRISPSWKRNTQNIKTIQLDYCDSCGCEYYYNHNYCLGSYNIMEKEFKRMVEIAEESLKIQKEMLDLSIGMHKLFREMNVRIIEKLGKL